jgi:hypothetical protein
MALTGGRVIEYEGHRFEWVVGRRGANYRAVIQNATSRGQLLVAWHPVYWLCEMNEAHGDYYKRTRVGAGLIGELIATGLRAGWRPAAKRLPPCHLGSPGGWYPGLGGLDVIDGLWALLSGICQEPGWRARLIGNTGEYVPLAADAIRGEGPALAQQVAEAAPLAVHVRPSDNHGDATPHLAVRSLAWGRDVVLEDISDWHPGWRRAAPGTSLGGER